MKAVSFESIMPLIEEAFSRGQSITIPVTGTSMMPLLRPKDAVTLTACRVDSIERGDILLYRRLDGRYVLHRVVQVKTDTVDFCGDNQVGIEKDVPKSCLIAQVISYEKEGIKTNLQTLRAEGCRRLNSRSVRAAATKWHRFRSSKSQKKAADNRSKQFLFAYIKQRVILIALMCILSCVGALSTLGMAFASGKVIDKALGGDMQNFSQWFWILFALLICVATCNVVYSNIRVRAVGKLRNDIRRDVFAALLTKQYTALQGIHTGEIQNRMTNDIQIVVDSAITLIPQSLATLVKLIGGLAFMLIVEPMFTSVVLAGGLVVMVLVHFSGRFYKTIHKECQETEGRTRSYFQECLGNVIVIKSFVNQKHVLDKLDGYLQDNLKKQIRRNTYANIGNTAIYTGFTFTYYAGLAWGVLRIAGVIGTIPMTVGLFATLLQIMEQIRSPFRSVSGVVPQIISMFASAERLYELIEMPDEPPVCLSETEVNQFDSLRFEEVSFSYEDGRQVLQKASVSLEKGNFAVLAGESGIGKTTMIKLLLGFVEPQKGKIVYQTAHGDRTIDASTRSLFAYVPQGNMLLSGTLRENVLFGAKDVSKERLDLALRLSCLDEIVAALPDGLDTTIGERGVGLSEGQLQRVAVARALLTSAPILLLDECTSALDEVTEHQLLSNLRSLNDRTILFISHRPAVLACADSLWVIENGSIQTKSLKNK